MTSPPPPTAFTPSATEQELFARSVKDIYFNYDSYELRASDQPTLQADAAFLKSHSNIRFTLEGHCDERGSVEYNLALGENRANSVKQALVKLGVPASSIKTISYGKEKPNLYRTQRSVLAAKSPCALRVRPVISIMNGGSPHSRIRLDLVWQRAWAGKGAERVS